MKQANKTTQEVERMAAAINANVDLFWNYGQSYEDFTAKQSELWREAESIGISSDLASYLGKRIRQAC